ncbi:hypothetical protein AGMMS49975_12760 [Clostridia bacterium]|nr:hypothetical protein AGMMS49975_12760 [Clostridia bacterium]
MNVIAELGLMLAKAVQIMKLPETERNTLIDELNARNIQYKI